MIERSHHDMGGLPAGRVERSEHDYADWERRVDALMVLLSGIKGAQKLLTVDELRKNIEALGPEAYDQDELLRALGDLDHPDHDPARRDQHRGARRARWKRWSAVAVETRFRPGERVKVMKAYPLGHVRTPYYIRGRSGVVERICGAFPNPEELAQMRSGLPAQPLYRVRFSQSEVWPDYRGARADTIDVEIFQHWLDKA